MYQCFATISTSPIGRRHGLLAGLFTWCMLAAACAGPDAERAALAGDSASAAQTSVAVADDTVRVDGSNGVLPLVARLVEAYREAHPTSPVVLGEGMGSKARLQALAERRIDVAVASHGLDSATLARDGLVAHRVAITPVVIGVNVAVPPRNVSSGEVCRLLRGEQTTWALPDGRSTPVHAFMRPEDEVDTEIVRAGIDCLADGMETASKGAVTIVQETADMARALAETPGAVGVTTATVVQQSGGRIRALLLDGVAPSAENVQSGRYRLVRGSYLVTRGARAGGGDPSREVQQLLAFMHTPRARAVLQENGSIPAR